LKILITLVLCTVVFWANSLPKLPQPDIKPEIDLKIEDKASQQEAIRFLENKINGKDYSSVLELGLLYEDGIIQDNGEKIPDLKKATEYYIMAFKKKDYRSVFKLVPMLLEKKEYLRTLQMLQEAIDNTNSMSMRVSAISIYSTLALDAFQANNDILVDALINIKNLPKGQVDQVPTLKFIMANLENLVGDKVQAELMLNEACNDEKAPDELKKICFNPDNFILVKDENVKSIEECTTCNLLKQ